MTRLTFSLGGREVAATPDATVVAGWTGRDEGAVRHHIDELAAIGVAPPSTVPLFYRVATSLLVQTDSIEVVGEDTSGEAEPVLIETEAGLLLTLGSDHTDRALEAHSVALSKQACAKPLAREAWAFEEVEGRLDSLLLRSWIDRGDGQGWRPYQDGRLAQIRPLRELLDGARQATPHGGARVTLCGTVPTVSGAIVPARRFRCILHDPERDRSLELAYSVAVLPHIN